MASWTLSPTILALNDGSGRGARVADAFAPASDPFSTDSHEGIFVATSVHGPAREQLRGWIAKMLDDSNRHDRLAVVTGEEGSGRSHLLTVIAREFASDARRQLVILPESPGQRTDAQILRAILSAIGADSTGRTGLQLRREIQTALRAIDQAGLRPGILIDGADFKGSHLELIRNLLRDAEGMGLWIVLFGTPDLHLRMSRRRSLRALMGPAIPLGRLPVADLDLVLDERIDAMRKGRTPEAIFPPEARTIIHRWSEGNIGQLIRIAGACLLAAATQGSEAVTPEIARRVARDLTIDGANGVRPNRTTSSGEGSVVQAQIPLLLDGAPPRSSSTTTQQPLWQEDEP
jgi:type II secretory pathway predicted ATPase ExeA